MGQPYMRVPIGVLFPICIHKECCSVFLPLTLHSSVPKGSLLPQKERAGPWLFHRFSELVGETQRVQHVVGKLLVAGGQ